MNADLSDYSGLRFNIVENPDQKMRLRVRLTTVDEGMSSTGQLPASALPAGSGVFELDFDDIPTISGNGVDLEHVDLISIAIWNGFVDHDVVIGAIELIPAEDDCPVGDLNCDGTVDVIDLLILLEAWGQCADPDNCPADLNGDGTVDVIDLLILLENWG